MNICGFLQNIQHFCFCIFRLLKLGFQISQLHHGFSCIFFVEVEDHEVVQLSFLILFDVELSFFELCLNFLFVNLTVENFSIFDNCLSNQNFYIGSIFNILLFVLFDRHVKRKLFGQKIFFDEETWCR